MPSSIEPSITLLPSVGSRCATDGYASSLVAMTTTLSVSGGGETNRNLSESLDHRTRLWYHPCVATIAFWRVCRKASPEPPMWVITLDDPADASC